MKMMLDREVYTEESTIGSLYVEGVFECFTLEDKVRAVKIKGTTAIPEGIYEVVVTYSNRFKRDLPLVKDVPGFDGIRIHPGNTAADTEGCVLVGIGKGKDLVTESRKAFDKLFEKIQEAVGNDDEITLTVQ